MNLRNMKIILEREYLQRVKKRSFIIMTILTPLIFLAISALPAVIIALTGEKSDSDKYIVEVIDNSGLMKESLTDNNDVAFRFSGSSEEALTANPESYSAMLIVGENIVEDPSQATLKMKKEVGMKQQRYIERSLEKIVSAQREKKYNIENIQEIISDLNVNVSVTTLKLDEQGREKAASSGVNFAMGYGGGFLIYIFIFMYGAMILNSVIDEKSSKVVEVMVSTVTPSQMMMGKILGIGLLAVTQFLIWGLLFFVGGNVALSVIGGGFSGGDIAQTTAMMQQNDVPKELAMVLGNFSDFGYLCKLVVTFIAFFFGGYLLYGSFFAAIASAVDNVQDVQQLQMPVTIPLIMSIIFMMSIAEDPSGPMAFWLSMFPLTSPIIMMARIPSDIPMWEILLSLTLLYASFIGMIWVAGRIYRVGIFMHGKKPSFRDLYKWIQYK